MKHTVIVRAALLLMFPLMGTAQNPLYEEVTKTQADSLKLLLKSNTADTFHLAAFQDLAYYYQETNRDSSICYAQQLTAAAKKMKLNLWEALGHWMEGYCLTMKQNYPEALQSLNRGLKLTEDAGNEKNVWQPKRFCTNGNPHNARLNLKANIIHDIGTLYGLTGKVDKRLDCYFETIAIAESIHEPTTLAIGNMNIGWAYNELNKPDSAFIFEHKALRYANACNFQKYKGPILSAIGNIYFAKGIMDSAQFYFRRALHTNLEQNLMTVVVSDYFSLTNFFITSNELDSALVYALKATTASRVINDNNAMAGAYYSMSSVYELKKNTDSALAYLKLFALLSDSNWRTDRENLMQYQRIGFNDQLKVQELEKEATRSSVKVRTYSLLAGIAVILMIAFSLYRNNREKHKANVSLEEKNSIITSEKKRSDELLLNILPAEVAEELKHKGTAEAKQFDNVTVLFTDFKSFTTISEKLSPQQLVDELHECFSAFDNIMHKYNIEKIKTVGDAYLAVSGLPNANPNHAEDMVKAAIEIQKFIANRIKERESKALSFVSSRLTRDGEGLGEVRIGIHSGHVVAGIVGVKKFAYDIWGDTVNTTARMEQNSEAGKINISETTYDLVKDKFSCEYRGEIEAKNKGKLKMYFVS